MKGTLKDVIDESIRSNNDAVRRNESRQERHYGISLKTKLTAVAAAAVLALGTYGGCSAYSSYKSYMHEQKSKAIAYSQQFDNVKDYFSRGSYYEAEQLCKGLEERLSSESYISPSRQLYSEVKQYNKETIKPKMDEIRKKERYERLKRQARQIPEKINEAYKSVPGIIKWGALAIFGLYLYRKWKRIKEIERRKNDD